jgi:transposase
MFIRQTTTGNSASNQSYFTYRLVSSVRIGNKVSQKTLLNLGRHFDIEREAWPELCVRIEQILAGERALFELPSELEQEAQSICAKIIALRGDCLGGEAGEETDFREVDVNSAELIRPRSVGTEHASLHALEALELPKILEKVGFNGPQKAAALANIIGRMCEPRSELATWNWMKNKSAVGELLEFDFESMPLMQLYRASDRLLKHKEVIEDQIFENVQELFGFTPTVTLYDLTNTFFEGNANANPKAKRGRSKEKRFDCPLITLGLMLDGSGFVRRSEIYEGSVVEGKTLQGMLKKLDVPSGALVVMDAGIATEENIEWLAENGFKYLVVSRKRKREFDKTRASKILSASGYEIFLDRRDTQDESSAAKGKDKSERKEPKELSIACWSEQRAEKDRQIDAQMKERFEAELSKLNTGLSKKGTTKKRDKVIERIGRLKQRYSRVAQHYQIDYSFDESQGTVTRIEWLFEPKQGSQSTHPGVYTLRTNEMDWDDEQYWRTYTMLTDLEAVFKSLKSELGMRPVYHHKEKRCDGHLFITVLAYQGVQVIRKKLKEKGHDLSWRSFKDIFDLQRRVTMTFKQSDDRTLHIRKATHPDQPLKEIYQDLGLSMNPGGIKKITI